MKKHFLGLAIAVFIGLGTGFAQNPRGGERPDMSKRIEQMTTTLGLNENQAKEFKAAIEEMRPAKNNGERPSREEMEKKRNEIDKKIKSILTEEQYKKYQEMQPKRGERRPQGDKN